MPLNIKNAEVESLAEEVASMAGESKTEAVRRALEERKERLLSNIFMDSTRGARLKRFLESEAWPLLPENERGRRLSKKEEEEILGFGSEGF